MSSPSPRWRPCVTTARSSPATSPRRQGAEDLHHARALASVAAITPFNHPLNQVAHKLAPAIAAGAPLILKPSEKTPLTAVRLVELLYEAGLPGHMLSCIHGGLDEITRPLIRDERVELVTFTGSAAVGKEIAATAGYKKTLPGTRRTLAAHRAGRCRPRPRRAARVRRLLPQQRPALHRRAAHPGAARRAGRFHRAVPRTRPHLRLR